MEDLNGIEDIDEEFEYDIEYQDEFINLKSWQDYDEFVKKEFQKLNNYDKT